MTRDELLVDTVERLNVAVKKLETIVGGDPDIGYRGLSQRVERLEGEMKRINNTRYSATQWTLGYMMLGVFIWIMTTGDIANIMTVAIGVIMFALAGLFLASGLGWFRWR